MSVQLPETMKAVRLHTPFDVRVEEVPTPQFVAPSILASALELSFTLIPLCLCNLAAGSSILTTRS